MIFNNSEFYTSLLMIELQEGVPFHESPISLNFGNDFPRQSRSR